MDRILLKKGVAVIAIAMLFLNLLFVGLRLYSQIVFWLILAIVAIASISIVKLVK